MEINNKEEEVWKDMPNHIGSYQASSFGRVRSLDRLVNPGNGKPIRNYKGKILSTIGSSDNHNTVKLPDKTYKVDRIICIIFHGEPPTSKHQVNHIDSNSWNDYYKNLEWMTGKENVNHSLRAGIGNIGDKHHAAKLNTKKVLEIKDLIKQGISHYKIAKDFNVSRVTIDDIANHKKWNHVDTGFEIRTPITPNS